MAIIKCPECGHEISDKAPFCPSCGVAISGKVITCPACGKVYFSEEKQCPQCHRYTEKEESSTASNNVEQTFVEAVGDLNSHESEHSFNQASNTESVPAGNVEEIENETGKQSLQLSHTENSDQTSMDAVEHHPSRGNRTIILAVLIIAIAVIGTSYYFYHKAQVDSERQAYEYAMTSNDSQVLQNYLDNYPNAPTEHRDSIDNHLKAIEQTLQDWSNTLVSGSRNALEQYLLQHPNSPYKIIALHKIDSIDWHIAEEQNSVEAIETYLENHPEGEHVDDANNIIKSLNSKTVQPEEKQMVISTMQSFFSGITNRDEDLLVNTVNPLLTKFLGKSNATKDDVVTFLHKIYKEDITSMSWQSLGDYVINKKDVGNQMYNYEIGFSSVQSVTGNDNMTNNTKYKIKATVNGQGKIIALEMIKMMGE